MSLFSNKNRNKRWQFRLSSLLLAMALCALCVHGLFVTLPRFIDGWKVNSGVILIHLTPAAQEALFDPPAPMGPMHETKVIVLRSLAYNFARALVVILLIVWITVRLRQRRRNHSASGQPKMTHSADTVTWSSNRIGKPQCVGGPVTSRIPVALAGGLSGALVGCICYSLVMKTTSAVPQTSMVGCAVGLTTGAMMARWGLETTCVAAGLLTIIVGVAVIIASSGL